MTAQVLAFAVAELQGVDAYNVATDIDKWAAAAPRI